MEKDEVIKETAAYVKKAMKEAEPCHDWWHIWRVWKLARAIGELENANLFVVELAALLHDIADYKFFHGDEDIGPRKAQEWLFSIGVRSDISKQVVLIIRNINYKGPLATVVRQSPEHAVVQDADRLDALGAIGIARAFSFGGTFKREIYNPAIKPNMSIGEKEYKEIKSTTVNHFFEKLFHLKDQMLTDTGRIIAKERTCFMQNYLDEFFKEWNIDISNQTEDGDGDIST